MFAGNFAPLNWQFCNGQLLPISRYTALFSLLGTAFGGNGTTTFALPNLQGSVPLGQGDGPGLSPYVIGEAGGTTTVTLTASQVPSHSHTYNCGAGSKGESNSPANTVNADEKSTSAPIYATSANVTMAPTMIQPAPASQAHQNMQPYVAVNFIIAMVGVFPARN